MQSVLEIALLAVACAVAATILYLGVKSPLRPYLIPLEGWRVAVAAVRTQPKTVALVALVIAASAGLQELFTYGLRLDNTMLTFASIGWQALVAMALAMIVVPFHLRIIGREPRGFVVQGETVEPRPFGALLRGAAALGGAIWLITYLLEVAGKLAIVSVPVSMATPTFRGVQLAGFLVAALLALIRPALSSGLRNPIAAGLRIAVAQFAALLLVEALLLIPPLVFGALAITLVRAYFGLAVWVHVLNDVSIVVFSTFQVLAFEASTVMLLRMAILTPGPQTDRRVAYAFARP